MRLAVTGTHGTGKTTLVEDFAAACRRYEAVPEPYALLSEQGMAFSERPTTADLEAQLAESCSVILDLAAQKDVIFDRCPMDFLAYLDVVSTAEGFEWAPHPRLLARIERALHALDTVIFVPLREPDEISAKIEYPKLRRRVDARLRTMLAEDDLGVLDGGPRVVEVHGDREQRLARLRAEIEGA
jgi:hypothetical protein